MSVSIPASDAASTQLNGVITALTSQLTSLGTANGPLVAKRTQDKVDAQMALVTHLLGAGKLTPGHVLSACTYGS